MFETSEEDNKTIQYFNFNTSTWYLYHSFKLISFVSVSVSFLFLQFKTHTFLGCDLRKWTWPWNAIFMIYITGTDSNVSNEFFSVSNLLFVVSSLLLVYFDKKKNYKIKLYSSFASFFSFSFSLVNIALDFAFIVDWSDSERERERDRDRNDKSPRILILYVWNWGTTHNNRHTCSGWFRKICLFDKKNDQ